MKVDGSGSNFPKCFLTWEYTAGCALLIPNFFCVLPVSRIWWWHEIAMRIQAMCLRWLSKKSQTGPWRPLPRSHIALYFGLLFRWGHKSIILSYWYFPSSQIETWYRLNVFSVPHSYFSPFQVFPSCSFCLEYSPHLANSYSSFGFQLKNSSLTTTQARLRCPRFLIPEQFPVMLLIALWTVVFTSSPPPETSIPWRLGYSLSYSKLYSKCSAQVFNKYLWNKWSRWVRGIWCCLQS